MSELNPYPLMFCPPGIDKPACCPHMGQVRVKSDAGPEGAGGICWGGGYDAQAGTWTKTAAGWWLNLNGQQPQHLTRMQTHPRILRWRSIPGALEGHWWQIPVLLTHVLHGEDKTYVSALDRIWSGTEWAAPSELKPIQERVLAVVNGIPLDMDLEVRNAAVRKLAVSILQIGQWVDQDFLSAAGWLSERMMLNAVACSADLEADDANV